MTAEQMAEQLIQLYEKHDREPGVTNAYPYEGLPLCAIGITALEVGGEYKKSTEKERNVFREFQSLFPFYSNSCFSFGVGFDLGWQATFDLLRDPESIEATYGNRDSYKVGKIVATWWKAKKELDSLEGSNNVVDRPTTLIPS